MIPRPFMMPRALSEGESSEETAILSPVPALAAPKLREVKTSRAPPRS